MPAMGKGRCGCFCFRQIKFDAVSFDNVQRVFVARRGEHMTDGEKVVVRRVLADFIRQRVDYDEKSYYIVAQFIDFDEANSDTVKLKQVQRLMQIIQSADNAYKASRKSSSEESTTAPKPPANSDGESPPMPEGKQEVSDMPKGLHV